MQKEKDASNEVGNIAQPQPVPAPPIEPEKREQDQDHPDEKKEIPVPPGDSPPLPIHAPGQQPEKPPAYV